MQLNQSSYFIDLIYIDYERQWQKIGNIFNADIMAAKRVIDISKSYN